MAHSEGPLSCGASRPAGVLIALLLSATGARRVRHICGAAGRPGAVIRFDSEATGSRELRIGHRAQRPFEGEVGSVARSAGAAPSGPGDTGTAGHSGEVRGAFVAAYASPGVSES